MFRYCTKQTLEEIKRLDEEDKRGNWGELRVDVLRLGNFRLAHPDRDFRRHRLDLHLFGDFLHMGTRLGLFYCLLLFLHISKVSVLTKRWPNRCLARSA